MRLFSLAAVVLLSLNAHAESEDLARDEVAVFKKKLVAMSKAVGAPPAAGYVGKNEDFNLPTQAYPKKGRYEAVGCSVNRRFAGDTKSAKKAEKDMSREYQKKMTEAMQRGDFQAIQQYQMEMQQKAGKVGGQRADADAVEPIDLHISINEGGGGVIDPDNVVVEKPGVIGIKESNSEEDKATVALYFDPADFKNPGKLSKVEMKVLEKGVTSKTAAVTAVIRLEGPAETVEAWAKKIDVKAVLAQLD